MHCTARRELRIAAVEEEVVRSMQTKAETLVKMVESLAHTQHREWEQTLQAVREGGTPGGSGGLS